MEQDTESKYMNDVPVVEESDTIPVEPSKSGFRAHQLELGLADLELTEPRASIETLCSLDISENIPRSVLPMDAEDSPWGGRWIVLGT